MKKTTLIALSLTVLSSSVFADRQAKEDFFENSAYHNSVTLSSKQDFKKSPSSKTSNEESPEGWGTWMKNKAYAAGEWVAEKGLRTAAGHVAAAYGTPYLNPVVAGTGEFADWAACGTVTAATGCYPIGWVAGKVAKTAALAAGYQAAPAAAFALGYNAKEIGEGIYNAGSTAVKGASDLYNAGYNWYYGN